MDLSKLMPLSKKKRDTIFGTSKSYMMTEIIALWPSMGCDKLSELLALANLSSLYAMFSLDGAPNEKMAAALAQAAVAM